MQIENMQAMWEAMSKVKHKGDAIVLSGTTGSGKSTVISELASHEDVQNLLCLREADGKGSTAETCIIATDYEAIPENCLLVSAQLRTRHHADCNDDNDLLAGILLSGAKEYKANQDVAAYDAKIAKEFENALKHPANESLAYQLRGLPADGLDELLDALKSFRPEEIFPVYQELLAKNPKKGMASRRTFAELLSSNSTFSEKIQSFWYIVVKWLNHDLEQLKKDLQDSGAIMVEAGDSSTFLVTLGVDDLDHPLTKTLLKSEDGSKEYLLSDLSLIFRGKPALFQVQNANLLTVSEYDGTPIRCWKLIDTQGLFHSPEVGTTDEADRILDILSTYHSGRLLIAVNSFINDTSKNGDMAICDMLSKANRPVEIYFLYSHWDEYLASYAQQTGRARRGERTKINWEACYQTAKSDQLERHNRFLDAIASNDAKKKPSVKGLSHAAFLSDSANTMETCLEQQGITYTLALPTLLAQVLKEQAQLGSKYRVTEGLEHCFSLDPAGLGTANISNLYNNLVLECKGKKLYASTVRACLRKWCRTGTKHIANVATNANGFVAIETTFVEGIRDYAMKYWGSLILDISPYLPEDTDGNQLQADLLKYLKESQYLGRETAKKIGAIAYQNGFAKNRPGNPFLYQYNRLDNMFSYVQTQYFQGPQIPFTPAFEAVLHDAVTECIQQFVDSRCVVVY